MDLVFSLVNTAQARQELGEHVNAIEFMDTALGILHKLHSTMRLPPGDFARIEALERMIADARRKQDFREEDDEMQRACLEPINAP